MPKPARDEDLYRTLALKIQAILRATLSEARGTLDPRSAVGRLVSETPPAPAPARLTAGAAARTALAAGGVRRAFALRHAGIVLQGASLTATYSLRAAARPLARDRGARSTHLSSGGVDAVAEPLPVLCGRARALGASSGWQLRSVPSRRSASRAWRRSAHAGSLDAATFFWRWAAKARCASGSPGRPGVTCAPPRWACLTARATTSSGVPILDTSRLQLSAGAGVGLDFNIP